MKVDNLTVVNLKGEETLRIDNEGNIYINPNEIKINSELDFMKTGYSSEDIEKIAKKMSEIVKGGLI